MYKRLFLIVTTLLLFACSNDSTVETDLNTTSTKPSEAIEAKPIMLSKPVMAAKPKTTAEEVLSENQIKKLKQEAPTLASAIALYNNEDSVGVDFNDDNPPELLRNLLLWEGIVGMTWEGLNSIPETNYDKIEKDVIAEAGKRFCFEGTVHKIQVDRSIKPLITNAVMYVPYRSYAYAIAVRSSGDILPSSVARFCGIVVGMNSAPYLIGMFDLPENKGE